MPNSFSTLEQNILKAKGVSAEQLDKLVAAGIGSRTDFATVGDAGTLRELLDLPEDIARRVIDWALGRTESPRATTEPLRIESADTVLCVHCATRQPKDYQSGDLCPQCGKQAEPTVACFWCSATGPGKFCRRCGAEHLPPEDLDLAIQLKRDGVAKDEVPQKLKALGPAEREALWGRVRRGAR